MLDLDFKTKSELFCYMLSKFASEKNRHCKVTKNFRFKKFKVKKISYLKIDSLFG